MVANVDADDKKNSKLAQKYGITGFPTIKFFSKDKKDEPEDYDGGRTEEEFVAFLNEKCGTKRAVGGGLNDEVRVFHNLFHFDLLFLVPSGFQMEGASLVSSIIVTFIYELLLTKRLV